MRPAPCADAIKNDQSVRPPIPTRMAAQRGLADTLAGLTAEAGHVAGRSGLTALAVRLYRWRLEMTRERQ